MTRRDEPPLLMTTREVAAAFRVDAKTVTRWGQAGRLLAGRTAGGHRRYFRAEVRALLSGASREEARKVGEAARDELAAGA